MERVLKWVIKLSAILWLLCVIGVFVSIGYVVGIQEKLFNETDDKYSLLVLGLILLGCISFLLATISFTVLKLLKRVKGKKTFILFPFLILITLAILPLYLLIITIKPVSVVSSLRRLGIKVLIKDIHFKILLSRILTLIFITLMLVPLWVGGYVIVGFVVADQLGYLEEQISISGTGSMYPTFPKGQGKDPVELSKQIVGTPGMIKYPNGLIIGNKRFLGYKIGRGDIVVIENSRIRESNEKKYGKSSGWVKRVIGLPGDTIELRSGIVYLNEKPLEEPYTARPRSTFGQTFLSECNAVGVPENSIFVMGDNRKGSGDSREIGFIEIDAVNHVIPYNKQIGNLDKNWRDTSKDFNEESKNSIRQRRIYEIIK